MFEPVLDGEGGRRASCSRPGVLLQQIFHVHFRYFHSAMMKEHCVIRPLITFAITGTNNVIQEHSQSVALQRGILHIERGYHF